jgi:hypothetical protein
LKIRECEGGSRETNKDSASWTIPLLQHKQFSLIRNTISVPHTGYVLVCAQFRLFSLQIRKFPINADYTISDFLQPLVYVQQSWATILTTVHISRHISRHENWCAKSLGQRLELSRGFTNPRTHNHRQRVHHDQANRRDETRWVGFIDNALDRSRTAIVNLQRNLVQLRGGIGKHCVFVPITPAIESNLTPKSSAEDSSEW